MDSNILIYGKNHQRHIVSMEVTDSHAELFIESYEGVKSKFVSNKYWLLANKPYEHEIYPWITMKGNLHYQYGLQFSTKEEFLQTKKALGRYDTYSVYDSKESLMLKDGYTYFKGMKLKDVSVLSFDIETTGLNSEAPDAKVLLISNTFRKGDKIEKKLFAYDDFNDPGDLFRAWCNWVREVNPTVIVGHNIFSYDLPYMYDCANGLGVELNLGRDGSSIRFDPFESKFRKDQTQDLHYKRAYIYGREIIDTMFLAVKYDVVLKKYESYGLKKIIEQEGLQKQGRVFYDASQIKVNYKNPIEWTKIKAYCIDDSDDALALYDLMAPPFFYMTQNIPKSFQSVGYSASGSQINSMMVRSYLQEGHSIPKASPPAEFEGAISLGNPGIYTNVFKIDVASLYPSIMIQYEVYDKQKDPQAYFKQLVSTFTEMRLEYKKKAKEDKYYDDLQNAYKIFINSCYGFLGTTGLNFNSPANASFITRTGREILKKSIAWAEVRGFRIVNADTDSISITYPDGRDFSEQCSKILEDVNSLFPRRISFSDDGFFRKVVVVKAKNYILFDGKKIKYKGSALKASTKEPALKEFIQKVIDAILTDKKNYSEIYMQYVKEIKNVKDIKRWVTRKTITSKVLNAKRTNEQKVLDAIEDSEYNEGDRIYTYFRTDGSLALVEDYRNDHDVETLLDKLYSTSRVFTHIDNKPIGILPKETFVNYALKRNAEALQRVV